MLEDQGRLGTCDVGVGIEVFDHERTQVLGVASGDVQDEIVGAGQKVDIHHLPFAADLLDEAADFPRADDCKLTEIIACNGKPTATGSMSV